MSIATAPIRLDRIQTALGSAIEGGLATLGVPAFWANTQPSQAGLPNSYVVLEMIVPPSPINVRNARGRVLNPTTSIDVVVSSAVTGARYTVEVNGYKYYTAGVGGDDVDTIAARLVAEINGDLLEPVTASPGGGGAVSLAADFPGALWSLELHGLLTAANQVIASDNVILTEADNTMLVNVQAFSKGQELYLGATAVLGYCYVVFQSPVYSESLKRDGLSVGILGLPTALPAVEGSRWESRASLDVQLTMKSTWVQPGSRIETVDVTTTLQPGNVLVQQTITAPTP